MEEDACLDQSKILHQLLTDSGPMDGMEKSSSAAAKGHLSFIEEEQKRDEVREEQAYSSRRSVCEPGEATLTWTHRRLPQGYHEHRPKSFCRG